MSDLVKRLKDHPGRCSNDSPDGPPVYLHQEAATEIVLLQEALKLAVAECNKLDPSGIESWSHYDSDYFLIRVPGIPDWRVECAWPKCGGRGMSKHGLCRHHETMSHRLRQAE